MDPLPVIDYVNSIDISRNKTKMSQAILPNIANVPNANSEDKYKDFLARADWNFYLDSKT